MKYTYAYKSSDGLRHEAAIDAPSRDVAFAALRAQGIKPIKVVAADGSKANGEVRGVRKRIAAAIAIAAALVAGAVFFFLGHKQLTTNNQPQTTNHQPPASAPRHQIYGDPVVMADFERGKFDACFTNRLDQMLAWFAQPGKLMCPKGTDPRRLSDTFASLISSSAPNKYAHICHVLDTDTREVRELKQIVNGMHEELAAYLANGNGTPRSYWRRLLERTQQELQIYERTRRELERETNPAIWEQKNDALRRLGLRTIPNPREGE